MKISELTTQEIQEAKERVAQLGGLTFSDGWDAAIGFVKMMERCRWRCKTCGRPVGLGVNYGGDICGEYTYCNDCWHKMTKADIERIIKVDFRRPFEAYYKGKKPKI